MSTRVLAVFLGLAVTAAMASATAGCQKGQSSVEITMAGDAKDPAPIVMREEAQNQAGALAWSQNCMRCHNLRNPMERSDREWDVIVHHMRVRANLTAEEHRLILRFLQSAN
ncbi:MAG: cytochrome c [Planctomycetes bacterium]|nr:cytochrome c [Planctomycetota bacterium]